MGGGAKQGSKRKPGGGAIGSSDKKKAKGEEEKLRLSVQNLVEKKLRENFRTLSTEECSIMTDPATNQTLRERLFTDIAARQSGCRHHHHHHTTPAAKKVKTRFSSFLFSFLFTSLSRCWSCVGEALLS